MALPIGFTASQNLPAIQAPANPSEVMYAFDSGTSLTMEDLNHHTIVLGTTGSGKTTSVGHQITASFIKRGCPGLIIDIKGNMLPKIRAIAAGLGRLDDVVEFGSSPTATPINFLANLTRSGVNAFFENLTKSSYEGKTGNQDFHQKGIKQATDCAQLLDFLHESDPAFERNAATVGEIIANPRQALTLYDLFKTRVFDPERKDHVRFTEEVECDRFHVLYDGKNERDRNSGFFTGRTDGTRMEQMNYALQAVRVALRRFLDSPGVAANFSAFGAPGLDMSAMLAAGKIVVLRFSPDAGPVEEDMCRMFIQDYYRSVYEIGMTLPTHSFMIVDEYQNIADLSDGRLADQRFVAMSREYKSCVVLLTQSMSAMLGGANDVAGMESLIANCNTRIVFYSDDPVTQEMARRYGDIDLTSLEPQQAFVIRYEAASRKHVQTFETVNEAYKSGQLALEAGKDLVTALKIQERKKQKPLQDLIELLKAKETEASRQQEEVRREKIHAMLGIPGATGDEPQQLPDRYGRRIRSAQSSREPESPPMPVMPRKSGCRDELISKFRSVFSPDAEVCILNGWRRFVEGALSALRDSGLEVKITFLAIDEGQLHTRNGDWNDPGMKYLNALLRETFDICGICGEAALVLTRAHRQALPLCESCRKKYGLWHEGLQSLHEPEVSERWGMDE